jgi:hypothetical protein
MLNLEEIQKIKEQMFSSADSSQKLSFDHGAAQPPPPDKQREQADHKRHGIDIVGWLKRGFGGDS